MKKALISLMTAALLVVALVLPAAAVDLSDPESLLPVDIIINQDIGEIRKVYDLSPATDPSTLPMASFERDGLQFDCTDILREVIIGSETQNMKQTETVDSSTKNMDTILSLLPQEREVTTEEGFSGTLRLNIDSIKTEPSGYGSSSKPVTATRSYPNLASADTSHLPKTVTEGGMTLTLRDVQWKTDNTYNADDYEIGDRFTAVCTYGGTRSVSYVKGYTTTADYSGEVYRTGVTVIRYTVIFTTKDVDAANSAQDPEETPTYVNARPQWPAIVFAVLAALGLGAGGTYLFMTKRKEQPYYEKTTDRVHDDAADGSDPDDSGAGA